MLYQKNMLHMFKRHKLAFNCIIHNLSVFFLIILVNAVKIYMIYFFSFLFCPKDSHGLQSTTTLVKTAQTHFLAKSFLGATQASLFRFISLDELSLLELAE